MYFRKVSVGRYLIDVHKTIDTTSSFIKLCHFTLQKSSTAVTMIMKGFISKFRLGLYDDINNTIE